MNAVRPRSGTFVALVAALVILLQGLTTAWADGRMAGAPLLDIFGNPICLTDSVDQSPTGDDHAKVPNCCTFGCPVAASALTAPPAQADVAAPHADSHAEAPQRLRTVVLVPPDHDPGNPRAPPLTA